MKTKHNSIVVLLFVGCFSFIKAQSGALISKDSIKQYVSILENENNLTQSPLLVIDGFAIDYEEYLKKGKPISKSNIMLIEYLAKDNVTAINTYAERAKGGVLLIITNKSKEKSAKTIDQSKILYLIGDKEISKKDLENIDPNDIEKVEVIKGEEHVKKITDGNYDGVIIITMKKDK